jgi:hypothetical protein
MDVQRIHVENFPLGIMVKQGVNETVKQQRAQQTQSNHLNFISFGASLRFHWIFAAGAKMPACPAPQGEGEFQHSERKRKAASV